MIKFWAGKQAYHPSLPADFQNNKGSLLGDYKVTNPDEHNGNCHSIISDSCWEDSIEVSTGHQSKGEEDLLSHVHPIDWAPSSRIKRDVYVDDSHLGNFSRKTMPGRELGTYHGSSTRGIVGSFSSNRRMRFQDSSKREEHCCHSKTSHQQQRLPLEFLNADSQERNRNDDFDTSKHTRGKECWVLTGEPNLLEDGWSIVQKCSLTTPDGEETNTAGPEKSHEISTLEKFFN